MYQNDSKAHIAVCGRKTIKQLGNSAKKREGEKKISVQRLDVQ